MAERYENIISLAHYEPKNHPRMSLEKRAAQFKPFAAVTGHTEAIEETARLTDEKIVLDEDNLTELDTKITLLRYHLSEHPELTIIYYIEDELKSGGSYKELTETIKKIDDYNKHLIMESGIVIPLGSILEIHGEVFEDLY